MIETFLKLAYLQSGSLQKHKEYQDAMAMSEEFELLLEGKHLDKWIDATFNGNNTTCSEKDATRNTRKKLTHPEGPTVLKEINRTIERLSRIDPADDSIKVVKGEKELTDKTEILDKSIKGFKAGLSENIKCFNPTDPNAWLFLNATGASKTEDTTFGIVVFESEAVVNWHPDYIVTKHEKFYERGVRVDKERIGFISKEGIGHLTAVDNDTANSNFVQDMSLERLNLDKVTGTDGIIKNEYVRLKCKSNTKVYQLYWKPFDFKTLPAIRIGDQQLKGTDLCTNYYHDIKGLLHRLLKIGSDRDLLWHRYVKPKIWQLVVKKNKINLAKGEAPSSPNASQQPLTEINNIEVSDLFDALENGQPKMGDFYAEHTPDLGLIDKFREETEALKEEIRRCIIGRDSNTNSKTLGEEDHKERTKSDFLYSQAMNIGKKHEWATEVAFQYLQNIIKEYKDLELSYNYVIASELEIPTLEKLANNLKVLKECGANPSDIQQAQDRISNLFNHGDETAIKRRNIWNQHLPFAGKTEREKEIIIGSLGKGGTATIEDIFFYNNASHVMRLVEELNPGFIGMEYKLRAEKLKEVLQTIIPKPDDKDDFNTNIPIE